MGAKTLLFGIDGLDHLFLDRLIDEGVAPNFKALRDRSRCADLRVYPGMGAGAFWASSATGTPPDENGRYFVLQFNPKTYDIQPFTEFRNLTAPAFWKVLDDKGKKVAVMDWHRGPIERSKNGLVIDGWMAHEPVGPLKISPPAMARGFQEKYGHNPIAGGLEVFEGRSEVEKSAFGHQTLARIENKVRFCIDQLTEHDWDLFLPCFGELHDVGHYFMHLADPDHALYDPELRERLGDLLRESYLAIDKAVGELIPAAGPDAQIFVLAGPGMEQLISANNAINEIAQKLDHGAGVEDSGIDQVRAAYKGRIPPRVRAMLSPIARRARRLLADNEYKHRRFFGLPHNDSSGCIRINLKGREKYGIIEPGKEYEALLEEIRGYLMDLKDAETGAPVVGDIIFSKHIFDGPLMDELPDIFVEWDRRHNRKNFTTITSERTGPIHVPPSTRTGDHTPHGFFWSTGGDAEIFRQPGPHMAHEVVAPVIAAIHG